jgi:hypothetical protein
MGQPAPEYVHRQIPTLLAAERAFGNDPGVRQSLDRRGNILLTTFANDDKGMDAGCWAVEHGNSIGEYKANISTISPHVGWYAVRAGLERIRYGRYETP